MGNHFDMEARVVKLISIDNKDCLFSDNKKYIVPEYQRDYSWGEEQLREFAKSINRAMSGKGEKVFMGTVQFAVDSNNPYEYHIIDGQQRMTTFILLCKLIGIDIIKNCNFEIKNFRINNDNLINALDFRGDAEKNRYLKNILLLKKEFSDTDHKKILNAVYENIYFVELKTINMALPEVVGIFNTINTTGLDLNCTDLFKLQYYEYLKARYPERDNTNLMSEICQIYERVNESKYCEMWHVLDMYKLCIAAENNLKWDKLSQSNERFFEEILNTRTINKFDILNFDSFKKMVGSYIDFYTRIRELNKELLDSLNDKIDFFATDLIWSTRYGWRFWTLPFVIAYFDNESDVLKKYSGALSKALQIAKYLIIYSVNYEKVVNAAHSFMCNEILPAIYSNAKADKLIRGSDLDMGRFTYFLKHGLKENLKRAFIVCQLSALLEELSQGSSIIEIKNKLFSWNENPYDIEHICAWNRIPKEDSDHKSEYNAIGNLVILERNINRSIKDKTVKEKVKDNSSKKNYGDSHFSIVKTIADNIKNNEYKWGLSEIEQRAESETEKICSFLKI